MDILLNHTSFDSEWLLESSDSYYCVENTPHLASAVALDQAIMQFSDDLSNKKILKYPKLNLIESEDDLNLISQILWDDVFLPLKIPEYFKFDIKNVMLEVEKVFKGSLAKLQLPELESEVKVLFNGNKNEFFQEIIDKNKKNFGESKLAVKLDLDKILPILEEQIKHFSFETFQKALESLNQRYEAMAIDFLGQALNNIKGTVRYHIIQLKNNIITKTNRLVANYFTILKNGKAACNNGWIINSDPLEDFACSGQFHYLRRTIIIWGDLVKLRYGKTKEESPFLWKHMKEYVRKMAKVFHGFRLDNAHSTPLHVGEYLMRKARKSNTDLLIISELFTGNSDLDAMFSKKIGFNGLVREAQRVRFLRIFNILNVGKCWDTPSLSNTLNNYGHIWKKTVGSLDKFFEMDLKTGKISKKT